MKKNTVKVTKTNKHNMVAKEAPKALFDEYFDMNKWRMTPVNDAWIERFAQRLVEWSKKDDSIKLTQFYREEGCNKDDIERWMERCPALKKAHAFALSAVGDRREINGLWKKMDAGIVSYTMSHYDLSWKMLAEWRAKLKAEAEQQQTGPQIVVIEKFPENKELVVDPSSPKGYAEAGKKETTQAIESDNFTDGK